MERPWRIESVSSSLRLRSGSDTRAASGARTFSSSASSTPNGPTAVRLIVRQCPPSVVGDRADVRPARDLQVELDERRLVAGRLAARGRGTADRHLDGDAAPVQPVGALALDLHRGGRGTRSSISPLERLDLLEPRGSASARRPRPRRRRCRAQAEPDLRLVALVEPDEVAGEPRRGARAGREEPARKRVERARVARLHAVARSQRAGRPRTTTGRPACRPGRAPHERAALTGLFAVHLREELAPDEVGDLLDARLAGEAGRLAMAAASALAGDRGDVEVCLGRPQADPVRRPVRGGRLADQRGDLGALDRAQVVDDPLGIRLLRAGVLEVLALEVGDDERPSLEDLRVLERARERASASRRRRSRTRPGRRGGRRRPPRRARRRDEVPSAVVFAYWKRPVSVTIAM